MWKRKKPLIAAALLATAIAFVVLHQPNDEPQYAGHGLSYWLLLNPELLGEDKEGLQHIGTNSIPWLLKYMQYEDSPWRGKLYSISPAAAKDRVWSITKPRSAHLAGASATVFRYLGTNGILAIPKLVDFMHNTNAPQTAVNAMHALSYLGTNGLPDLIFAAQDPKYSLRVQAAAIIAFTPPTPESAKITTPVFAQLLYDTNNPQIPHWAAFALTNALRWDNLEVRTAASNALQKSASEPHP
jgi:hypothetical protein